MSAKGLDKNSIIGLVLIGAILLVFTYLTQPTPEELAAKKQKEATEKAKTEQVVSEHNPQIKNTKNKTSEINITSDSNFVSPTDSLQNLQLLADFGPFVSAAQGEEQTFTIENEQIIATISNKGGRITSVQLKEFVTYDSLPLILFNKDSSRFNIEMAISGSTGGSSLRLVNTENLYFETSNASFQVNGEDKNSITLKLSTTDKSSYIEYIYTLKGNSYLVDFDFNIVGFNDVLLEAPILQWEMFTPSQEKTIKNQEMASTTYYKYNKDEVDYIGYGSYKKEELISAIDWVMFKQQYFNSTLIAKKDPFLRPNSFVETIQLPENPNRNYVKQMRVGITIPFNNASSEKFAMQFYFGPNKIETLKNIGFELDKSIDYGWGIFGWVNHLIVRPVFNFLMRFDMSIGIVILLLTIIIKMLLFPITWKTYLSSAKMKVLKPEITELTEKYKNDAMKKQQETMALYRKTGVNPLAGCIPMLIQMPILFALFRFFPATFDLRQKSFLWAEDLSSYDSILELPFEIPFYGAHVSLFTLLMAISMIFYTKANSQMTSGAGMEGAMAAQMKIMTYLMPVMMLFFFNSYASGLSYYYLIANMITIGQQAAIKKWFIDENKILAKIQENKTKIRKKSGFGAKLEAKMKEAQKLQQQRKKKG